MVREVMIFIYLVIVRILFTICSLFPIRKNRTVFVVSFGDNASYAMRELIKSTDEEIIILKDPSWHEIFPTSDRIQSFAFTISHPLQFIRSYYYLATARTVFLDNYFGFLAVVSFRKEVRCIQLWHAAGAMKQFGMQDASNQYRTASALKRFQRVYNSFSHVVVGSHKMANVFRKSFGTDSFEIIPTGVPRTDFFFMDDEKSIAINELLVRYPTFENKRVLLYAPTYRDNELLIDSLPLDLKKIEKAFGTDSVLLLKLHPAVEASIQIPDSDFVFNVSDDTRINDLLLITDILITDYSSIPFEFALLNRPMIFYAYDLELYEKKRGLQAHYEDFVPGPIVKTTDDMIKVIKENRFSLERIQSFSDEWNTFSTGQSSQALIAYLYHVENHTEKQKMH